MIRMTTTDIFTQVDLSSAKQNNIVAGLLKSAMLPLQQVVDGRNNLLNKFKYLSPIQIFVVHKPKSWIFSPFKLNL